MQARADKSDAALSRICVLQRELDFDENSLEASEFLALAHRMGHVQMTKAQARSFSPLLLAVPLLVVEVVKCV
jgi:hypothetical protein